ncbi:MAG: thioredoxin family protein [Smithellaceae bacterium]|nr:thioredoxin family protein [Smithellaceae bacterium]
MKIEILGTGCAKCHKLYELVLETIKTEGIAADVSNVQDIKKIMAYGVMTTPAIVVDGEVKVVGKIPTADEIKRLLGSK